MADKYTDQQIRDFIANTKIGTDPAAIAKAAAQYGVSQEQLNRAIGSSTGANTGLLGAAKLQVDPKTGFASPTVGQSDGAASVTHSFGNPVDLLRYWARQGVPQDWRTQLQALQAQYAEAAPSLSGANLVAASNASRAIDRVLSGQQDWYKGLGLSAEDEALFQGATNRVNSGDRRGSNVIEIQDAATARLDADTRDMRAEIEAERKRRGSLGWTLDDVRLKNNDPASMLREYGPMPAAQNGMTAAQIRDYVAANKINTVQGLYEMGQKFGLSGHFIDSALGLNRGSVSTWAGQNFFLPLSGKVGSGGEYSLSDWKAMRAGQTGAWDVDETAAIQNGAVDEHGKPFQRMQYTLQDWNKMNPGAQFTPPPGYTPQGTSGPWKPNTGQGAAAPSPAPAPSAPNLNWMPSPGGQAGAPSWPNPGSTPGNTPGGTPGTGQGSGQNTGGLLGQAPWAGYQSPIVNPQPANYIPPSGINGAPSVYKPLTGLTAENSQTAYKPPSIPSASNPATYTAPDVTKPNSAYQAPTVNKPSSAYQAPTLGAMPSALTATPMTQAQSDGISVEKRLGGLLSQSNPLFKTMADKTMADFNSRGLLNSSMAVQGANEVVMGKAFDIANVDAGRFSDHLGRDRSFEQGSQQAILGQQLGERNLSFQDQANWRDRNQAFEQDMSKLSFQDQAAWRNNNQAYDQDMSRLSFQDQANWRNTQQAQKNDLDKMSFQDQAAWRDRMATQQQERDMLGLRDQAAFNQRQDEFGKDLQKFQVQDEAAFNTRQDQFLKDLQKTSVADQINWRNQQADYNFRSNEAALSRAFENSQIDKQTANKLMDSYRTDATRISDQYSADAMAINTSDLPVEVKQAQLAGLQAITQSRMNMIQTLYRNTANWAPEWKTVAAEFGR